MDNACAEELHNVGVPQALQNGHLPLKALLLLGALPLHKLDSHYRGPVQHRFKHLRAACAGGFTCCLAAGLDLSGAPGQMHASMHVCPVKMLTCSNLTTHAFA